MRVRSVQLGGSLAGKLSSELSSTLSFKFVALGISGRRLRRPLTPNPRAGYRSSGFSPGNGSTDCIRRGVFDPMLSQPGYLGFCAVSTIRNCDSLVVTTTRVGQLHVRFE